MLWVLSRRTGTRARDIGVLDGGGGGGREDKNSTMVFGCNGRAAVSWSRAAEGPVTYRQRAPAPTDRVKPTSTTPRYRVPLRRRRTFQSSSGRRRVAAVVVLAAVAAAAAVTVAVAGASGTRKRARALSHAHARTYARTGRTHSQHSTTTTTAIPRASCNHGLPCRDSIAVYLYATAALLQSLPLYAHAETHHVAATLLHARHLLTRHTAVGRRRDRLQESVSFVHRNGTGVRVTGTAVYLTRR